MVLSESNGVVRSPSVSQGSVRSSVAIDTQPRAGWYKLILTKEESLIGSRS